MRIAHLAVLIPPDTEDSRRCRSLLPRSTHGRRPSLAAHYPLFSHPSDKLEHNALHNVRWYSQLAMEFTQMNSLLALPGCKHVLRYVWLAVLAVSLDIDNIDPSVHNHRDNPALTASEGSIQ